MSGFAYLSISPLHYLSFRYIRAEIFYAKRKPTRCKFLPTFRHEKYMILIWALIKDELKVWNNSAFCIVTFCKCNFYRWPVLLEKFGKNNPIIKSKFDTRTNIDLFTAKYKNKWYNRSISYYQVIIGAQFIFLQSISVSTVFSSSLIPFYTRPFLHAAATI